MTKILFRNFIIFLSLSIVSCSYHKNNPQQIRIVDLQGHPRPVTTRVPELNAQILASQGALQQEEGRFKDNASAQVASSQMPQQQNIAQNKYASPINNSAAATITTPTETTAAQPAEITVAAGTKEEEIEYDLSSESKAKPNDKKVKTPKGDSGYKLSKPKDAAQTATESTIAANPKKGIFVQVGSFSNEASAKITLKSMQKFHKGSIEEATKDDSTTIYRVILGPFPDKVKARTLIKKIKSSGHDAILVRNK